MDASKVPSPELIEKGGIPLSITIDEAIAHLTELTRPVGFFLSPDLKDSILLGIQALMRVRNDRRTSPKENWYTLPGETTN